MTSYVWIGGAGGDFDDPGNWSPMGVPGAGDDAAVSGSAASATISTDGETIDNFTGGGTPDSLVIDDNTFLQGEGITVTGTLSWVALDGGSYQAGTFYGALLSDGTLSATTIDGCVVTGGEVTASASFIGSVSGGTVQTDDLIYGIVTGGEIDTGSTGGQIDLNGGTVDVTSALFTETSAPLYGPPGNAGFIWVTAGTFSDSGTLALNQDFVDPALQVSGSGQTTITGAVSDIGSEMEVGAVAGLAAGGTLTMDAGLSLSAGAFLYIGAGGTVTVNDTTTDAGVIGVNGALAEFDTNALAPLTGQELSVDSGGYMSIAGGTVGRTANQLQIGSDGALAGYGMIHSSSVPSSGQFAQWALDIDNDGTIEADNGTLVLNGNLSGDGQVLVGDGSTLELGGTVADDVTAMFLPSTDGTNRDSTIAIDDPEDFQGVISSENFEPGDMIDLPNVPYIDPGQNDDNPDGASFYFETGEGEQNYVLQVVEDDQNYDIPINKDDDAFSGGFTLSDDGNGGTLVTDTDVAETGYSVTAASDGPETQPYLGVVQIETDEKSGTYDATGFYIAENFILTNAHVVDGPGLKKVITEGKAGGQVPATWWKSNTNFAQESKTGDDLGILYVPTGSPSYIFQLQANFAGGAVDETGYPGAPTGELGAGQVSAHGTVSLQGSGVFTKDKALDLGAGSSGSPYYTDIEGQIKAVGVNSAGSKFPRSLFNGGEGVELTAGDLAMIKNWERLALQAPQTFYTRPPTDVDVVSAAVSQGDDATGQTVQFILNTSENVTVTGSGPALSLNDGGTATYNAANSTGTELEFDYIAGAGDQTASLEITQINSAQTVQGPGGTTVDFTVLDNLPTGLSINAPLVVTSVASSQSGEVDAGVSVQLILTLSEAVTVSTSGGAPTLTLNDGATAIYDAAASILSTGTLVFDYTAGNGDETANLEVTSVDLPTGTTIRDAAGYNADFSAAINIPTGLQVGPAYITAITPSLTSALTTGQTEQVTLAMSQGVTINTTGGSPTLSLSDGATATYDAAASNPSAGTLVFDYTAGSGDYTTDLQLLSYDPNGAAVIDTHGVNADFSGATRFDLALDVNAAIVTNLTPSLSSGEADSGQTVTLTLTMSGPVTVNLTGGSPTLSLNDGATASYDGAASNPSTGTLAFDYTVGASDEMPSLQIGQVNLNGATIDDGDGNAADLSAATSFTTNLQIGPAFVTSLTPSLSGVIFTGQTDQLTLAMSQGVTIVTTKGSPTLSLSDGATATYDSVASDPSTGTLVFDYTVGAGDYTTDLTMTGYNPNGTTVTDTYGVNADFSGAAQYDLSLDVNAASIIDVTSSPSSGEADSGTPVTVTLTMNEAVTVNTTKGAPTLSLSSGATATYDSAASNPSAGTLVFDDTVGATDETPNLRVIQVYLNGATINDANGNAADLSAASSFSTGLQVGPVVVDSVTPSLSGDVTTGQTVQLTVSMSAGLTVANGSPTLSLSDGASATYDTAASEPSAGTLVFDYTVAAGEFTTSLSVAGLIAHGATIMDANGISPDFSGLTQSWLGIDVNAATVTNVTAAAPSNDAQSGQQVLLTLTMSEQVTVNMTGGSPRLDLSDGAIATYDSAASNPGADALVFTYTVGTKDEDPNLQIAQVRLNGATIDDANGKAADLSAAATIATNLQIGTVVQCYAAGTRIATGHGEVAVEALRAGDLVRTAMGRDTAPIVWIGHRHVDCERHPDPRKVWPVRVRAGTFGEDMPRRDLWLSPDHAVFVDDVLVPIRHLLNGTSIAQEAVSEVTYFHVELPEHNVLIAEGLPAESYLDTGDRSNFTNGGDPVRLFPEFTARTWEALGCAPLIVTGPKLDEVRRRIADYATRRGGRFGGTALHRSRRWPSRQPG